MRGLVWVDGRLLVVVTALDVEYVRVSVWVSVVDWLIIMVLVVGIDSVRTKVTVALRVEHLHAG